MVKLGGPAMSLDASGTIGGILTFSKWKGRAYVRTRVIPANPKSDPQMAVRAMMKFLAQQWAGIATIDKATWDVGAEANKISPFNQYTKINLRNWRDFLPPGKKATLLRAQASAVISGTVSNDAGRYAQSVITLAAAPFNWGSIVYMSDTTGFTPNWNNARLFTQAVGGAAHTINIGPLPAGVYYLRFATFSIDGLIGGAYATEDTVTIV